MHTCANTVRQTHSALNVTLRARTAVTRTMASTLNMYLNADIHNYPYAWYFTVRLLLPELLRQNLPIILQEKINSKWSTQKTMMQREVILQLKNVNWTEVVTGNCLRYFRNSFWLAFNWPPYLANWPWAGAASFDWLNPLLLKQTIEIIEIVYVLSGYLRFIPV